MSIDLDPRFERALSSHLRASAVAADPEPTPLSSIVVRASRRQARVRTARVASSIVAVAMIAGTGALIAIHRPASDPAVGQADNTVPLDDQGVAPADQDPAASDGLSAPTLVDSAIDWQRVDSPVGESLGLSRLSGTTFQPTAPFYALATQPGSVRQSRRVYTSSDGLTWQSVSGPVEGLGKLAVGGGRLYSLGTAATSASTDYPAIDLVGQVSSDGGRSWQASAGLLDVDSIRDLPYIRGAYVVQSSIAASDTRVVIAAKMEISIDYGAITPRANTEEWVPSADGTKLYFTQGCRAAPGVGDVMPATVPLDPSQCVTDPSDQVDLTTALDPAVLNELNRMHFFTSTDGVAFEEIDVSDSPIARHVGGFSALKHTSAGFVYLASTWERNASVERFFTSTDGLAWTALPEIVAPPNSPIYAEDFDVIDGVLTLVRASSLGNGFELLRLVGGVWQTNDLGPVLAIDGHVVDQASVTVDPSGVTVAAHQYLDPVIERGGVTLTSNNGYRLEMTDSMAGFAYFSPDGQRVDQGEGAVPPLQALNSSVVVLRTFDGAELASFDLGTVGFSSDTLAAAPVTVAIARSADGVHWSRDDVGGAIAADRSSPDAYPRSVDVYGERIVVRMGDPGSPMQSMLVGTLKG